jgi:mannose-6-phosphate isomerase-like protein (cupin superfamily)
MHRIMLLTASVLVVTTAGGAQAKTAHLKWMADPALPAGAMISVVKGDPSKAGSDFVVRAKLPANYAVPPHHHPTDETVRVIGAGSLSYGMGDKVNASDEASLTKGYHVTMQAGMNHWASNTDPVEIEISGKGPFEIVYVNPADDPRNKK